MPGSSSQLFSSTLQLFKTTKNKFLPFPTFTLNFSLLTPSAQIENHQLETYLKCTKTPGLKSWYLRLNSKGWVLQFLLLMKHNLCFFIPASQRNAWAHVDLDNGILWHNSNWKNHQQILKRYWWSGPHDTHSHQRYNLSQCISKNNNFLKEYLKTSMIHILLRNSISEAEYPKLCFINNFTIIKTHLT